ncbi:chemotaxis protein CheC [Natranaerofaba carboxydovora]|uniref:chemotaxis protein CheC n=1 Tax=Natranaerofaba carboxydovora TaxID=2742683 RepID=UPI001F13E931|nr:chemotaxis protein CheC [Natranaerofaba carboxydovora]UMZ73445.1 CheY-P phosphatase CheC [Natranaerofaba carboxydovora]
MLSSIQEDALKEFMNIYIGQASSLLSDITGEKIELKIPEIKLLNFPPGKKPDIGSLNILPKGDIISSSLSFGDELKGKARLVFPADKTRTLVNLCLGEDALPDEEEFDLENLTDIDSDAMRELGNIVLNSIMGGLANLTGICLNYSIPEIEVLYFPKVEAEEISLEDNLYVLIIKNTFSFSNTEVEGAILVALSIDSVNWLIKKIDEEIVRMYE